MAKNGGLRYPDHIVAQARELAAEGLTLTEIGRRLGINRSTITGWVSGPRRAVPDQIERPPRPRYRHPVEKVAKAKQLFAQGMTRTDIALKLGVPRNTVGEWLRRNLAAPKQPAWMISAPDGTQEYRNGLYYKHVNGRRFWWDGIEWRLSTT